MALSLTLATVAAAITFMAHKATVVSQEVHVCRAHPEHIGKGCLSDCTQFATSFLQMSAQQQQHTPQVAVARASSLC
jgi:hypothetical protein